MKRIIWSATACFALLLQGAQAHEVQSSEAENLAILWSLTQIIPAADCKGISLSWTEIQDVVATGEEMMDRAIAEMQEDLRGEIDGSPLWKDMTDNMLRVPEYVSGPDGFLCDNIKELFDMTKHLLNR